MFGSVCNHAGATTLAEPGPQPSQALRYVSTAWCSTPKFLLVHSWTNGELRYLYSPESPCVFGVSRSIGSVAFESKRLPLP